MQEFEQTRKLLHNSTIYYLIAVNMDSNYSYVNDRYQGVFNNVHGQLVGQHYSITMHPDDLETCRTVANQAFTEPEKIFPAIIRKHDGKGGYVITQWEYKAMFDKDGAPAGVFCIGHDITEFMKNSIELKDTRDNLTKTQFTLEQIAYIQSHVVRKPIANIMGLSSLIDAAELEPAVKSMFELIRESAKELDQLIRNMSAKV